ncbi:MAG: MFS transporter [Flavonifractor plautii]
MGRAVGGRAAALLLAGRTVSRFGSSFYLVALPLYVLERTGSLGASGLFFTLTSLPPLLAVPFLGPLVERTHRKGLLILCDFGASALCALLLLFPGPPLPFLLTGTMLFHLLSHLFEIASKVLFSELCPPERLSSLNGIKACWITARRYWPLRRARFCLTVWIRAILLCAPGYGLSALQECFIPYAPRPIQQAEPPRLRAGIRYLLGRRELFSLFLLVMALNFFVANSEEIIFPGILVELYQFPESRYGLAVSASTAGTLLASLFLIRAAHLRPLEHLRALFLVNSALMAALGLAAPLLRSAPKLYFVLFFTFQLLIGWLTACINVPLISYFQTRVPLEQQGRFFALLAFFSGILIPLGISYTGVLADWLGPGAAYACNNLCVIVLVLLVRLPA